MADPHHSRLELTPEEMREAGYRTVDLLVRHLTDGGAPPIRRATPAEMRKRLAAGFGYARTAAAIASTAVRALVIPAGDVGELIRDVPVIGDRLRAIARSRLHQP